MTLLHAITIATRRKGFRQSNLVERAPSEHDRRNQEAFADLYETTAKGADDERAMRKVEGRE